MKEYLKLQDRILATIRKAYERFRRTWKPEPGTFIVSINEAVWSITEKPKGRREAGPLPRQVQKFCDKFKIPYPYPPETSTLELPPIILVPRYQNGKHVVGPDENLFFTVRIDVTRSRESIVEEMKRLYKKFGVKDNRTKHKDSLHNGILKESGRTIWDIHNMVKQEKGNLYGVAKKLGMKGKPTDSVEDGRIYKAVRDANRKVNKMIFMVRT